MWTVWILLFQFCQVRRNSGFFRVTWVILANHNHNCLPAYWPFGWHFQLPTMFMQLIFNIAIVSFLIFKSLPSPASFPCCRNQNLEETQAIFAAMEGRFLWRFLCKLAPISLRFVATKSPRFRTCSSFEAIYWRLFQFESNKNLLSCTPEGILSQTWQTLLVTRPQKSGQEKEKAPKEARKLGRVSFCTVVHEKIQ